MSIERVEFMKEFKKLIVCLILSIFIIPLAVKADSGEYYSLDDNVNIDNRVDHNYFALGNTLNDNGITKGILFALANNLTSDSEMDYGVMLGNNVSISSDIDNDLFLIGNLVKIDNANIKRDVYISGNSIRIINSTIGNTVFLSSESLKLENVTINGNVNVDVSNLEIADNVIINGNLYYNEDAKVTGLNKIDCHVETYEVINNEVTKTKKDIYKEIIISCLSLLIIAILITCIYNKAYLKVTMDVSFGEVFKYMGLGILLIIAVPIIAVLLMMSLVGLPLGLILLVLYGLALYLSLVWMGMIVGRFLHIKNRVFGTILGVLIVKGLTYVPYVGGFLCLVFVLIGMGLALKVMRPSMMGKKKVLTNNENKEIKEEVKVEAEVKPLLVEEVKEENKVEVKEEPKEKIEEVVEVKEKKEDVVKPQVVVKATPKKVTPKTTTVKKTTANKTTPSKKTTPTKKATPSKKTTKSKEETAKK